MRGPDCAISARQLLTDYRTQQRASQGELIQFDGVGDRDVYNVTAPFNMDGTRLIAGRVERRDTELSQTMLFVEDADRIWRPHPGASSFPKLQDPCVSFIGDELVLGGVEFPVDLPGRDTPGWRMAFYRGESLESLRLFLHGPDHMKDIRLGPLSDGRIAVCSRPQGARGGRGQIGFTAFDSLDDVSAESIEAAPLLTDQFLTQQWGGANELHLLDDGRLGILGHIAWMRGEGADEEKYYYPMTFTLDPASSQYSPLQIIASRDDFPAATPKRPGLRDVIFSGGLDRDDGGAWLYAGLSDAAAGRVRIADPFADV